MDTKEQLQQLISKITLEKIETKDLIAEINNLFEDVERLTSELEDKRETIERIYKENSEKNEMIEEWRAKYFNPYNKFQTEKEAFVKDKFRFEIEKEYLRRENHHLKEVLSAVVSRTKIDESYHTYGGTTGATSNWDKSIVVEKPDLNPNLGRKED